MEGWLSMAPRSCHTPTPGMPLSPLPLGPADRAGAGVGLGAGPAAYLLVFTGGMTRLLSDEEITRQLRDLPAWSRDGDTIRSEWVAPDFLAGVRVVDEVAAAAEAMDHHPDIDIRWTTLRFALSTHSEGGLTQLDIELAHQIAQEAARLGAEPKTSL